MCIVFTVKTGTFVTEYSEEYLFLANIRTGGGDSFYPTVTATTKTLSKKRVFVHLHQSTDANAASITSASANVKILSDVVFDSSKNLVVEVTGNIGDEFVINTSLTNGIYCGVAILG